MILLKMPFTGILETSRVMSFDNRMTASNIATSSSSSSPSSRDTNNNNSGNSSNSSQNRAAQSCRRRLFETEVNPEEQRQSNIKYLRENLTILCDESSQKYNFDFVGEKPLSPREGQTFTWSSLNDEQQQSSTNSSSSTTTTILSTTVISTTQKKPVASQKRQPLLINHLPVVSRARVSLKRQASSTSNSSNVTSSCGECPSKRAKSV